MSGYWLLIAVLLPIIGGALVMLIPFPTRKAMCLYLEILMAATSAIVLNLTLRGPTEVFDVINFMQGVSISFRVDGMSMVFATLVAVLWPLAMLYSFEYMEHEEHQRVFFMFYAMTYGVTLGIAFAANILCMYIFYELLTLVTVPLILHSLTREAVLASRKYLYYSFGGAAFALIAIIFVMVNGTTLDFTLGGVFPSGLAPKTVQILMVVYVLGFMGFGVKAAIWPLCSWLPQAGVAPTPVTALLHAVAVVKAGVFAIIRLTYYSFGTDLVKGTWAQAVVMGFAMFTIVYGCYNAVKETHIKRRLAYSTVSNLSYVIFGAAIMTPQGMTGALCHLVCHAFMKIGLFLCAGSIMHQTGVSDIRKMNGFGRKMPVVFICYTIAGLGLMGVPGLAGFVSKWSLAGAAAQSGSIQAFLGVGCLMISAFLTAIYTMSLVVRAFFPGEDFDYSAISSVKDPTWRMCIPLCLFAAGVILFGLTGPRLTGFLYNVSTGIY